LTESGRLRFLVVTVVGASLLLVLAARWTGRLAAGGDLAAGRRPHSSGAATRAGAGAPDLTFYRTLGAAPAPGRRAAGAGAAEPILRPAPGDAVPAGTAYVVQALATRDESQARRLRDRLASRGMPAVVVEDDSGDTPIYRVRVGRWRERATAEALAGRLRSKEGLDPWVLQEAGP